MNNKLWLTSMVAIGLALPASAATFPTNGYMKPTNGQATTYTGAATSTNMGVSSGTANADAYYNILAGYYLPANSYEAAQCTAGNYCTGVTNIKSTSSAQGITSACPSGYPNSDVGASSSFYCYRNCTNSDIVTNGTGFVSGGRYHDGVNMCWTSGCAAGYALTTDIEEAIYNHGTVSSSWTSSSGTPSANGATLQSDMGHQDYWAVDFGDSGILYGDARVGTNSEKLLAPNATFTTGSNQNCFCNITGYIDVPTQTADSAHTYQNLAMTSAWVNIGTTSSSTTLSECLVACKDLVAGGTSDNRSLLFQYRSSPQYCKARYYDVTYSCGTGTGTNPPQGNPEYNKTYTVSSNTHGSPATAYCTKEGYAFNNWKDGAGTTRTAGTNITWTYTSAQTFTAQWSANSITLNWDENGGSAVTNGTCTYDSTLTLPVASTREGYEFAGWKLYGTNGAVKNAGSTVTNGCTKANTGAASDTSTGIKAQWTANTITLNWDENGGSAVANGTCTYDGTLTLPAAPTRAGYDFDGWKLKSGTIKDASSTVSAGCTKANTGVASGTSTEIVAQWKGKTITIKWYGVSDSGNTNGVFETSVTYGGDITTPTTPKMSASGQVFRGWVFRK